MGKKLLRTWRTLSRTAWMTLEVWQGVSQTAAPKPLAAVGQSSRPTTCSRSSTLHSGCCSLNQHHHYRHQHQHHHHQHQHHQPRGPARVRRDTAAAPATPEASTLVQPTRMMSFRAIVLRTWPPRQGLPCKSAQTSRPAPRASHSHSGGRSSVGHPQAVVVIGVNRQLRAMCWHMRRHSTPRSAVCSLALMRLQHRCVDVCVC